MIIGLRSSTLTQQHSKNITGTLIKLINYVNWILSNNNALDKDKMLKAIYRDLKKVLII